MEGKKESGADGPYIPGQGEWPLYSRRPKVCIGRVQGRQYCTQVYVLKMALVAVRRTI